jgi:hypothetical protein
MIVPGKESVKENHLMSITKYFFLFFGFSRAHPIRSMLLKSKPLGHLGVAPLLAARSKNI